MVNDKPFTRDAQTPSSFSGPSLGHSCITERPSNPVDAYLRSRILMSVVLGSSSQRTLVANLKGKDAQYMSDYLEKVRPSINTGFFLNNPYIVLGEDFA